MGMSDYVRGLRDRIGNDFLLMPTVAAIVRNESGRILLVQGVEGPWQLPGGAVDPDEHPEEALQRECREEANAIVRPIRLLAAVGGPQHRHTYANGTRSVSWSVFTRRSFSAVNCDRTTRRRRRSGGSRGRTSGGCS